MTLQNGHSRKRGQSKAEKERRLKLIHLIFLVELVKVKKSPPKTIKEAAATVLELNGWLVQYKIISGTPVF